MRKGNCSPTLCLVGALRPSEAPTNQHDGRGFLHALGRGLLIVRQLGSSRSSPAFPGLAGFTVRDVMGLADRLAAPPKRTNGSTCSMGRLLARLDTADAEALKTALLAKSDDGWLWSDRMIEAEIKDEGETVGSGAVGKHRRKQCSCWR